MLAGKLYDPADPELAGIRAKAHKLSQDYNATYDTDEEKRQRIIDELLPHHADGCYLQGPIYFDYGTFTKTGKNFYANFNLTVLDSCPVTIGDNVYFGPNCTLATPVHPLVADERRMFPDAESKMHDREYARPITIGNDCWIASNVVICGGVTIGDRVVIGAGSALPPLQSPVRVCSRTPFALPVRRRETHLQAMPRPLLQPPYARTDTYRHALRRSPHVVLPPLVCPEAPFN